MPALLAASAKRTEHEIETHGYHHKTLQEQAVRAPFTMSGARTKRTN